MGGLAWGGLLADLALVPHADAMLVPLPEEIPADVAEGLATTLIAAYEGATALARVQRSRAPLDAAAEAMIRLVAASR